MQTENKYIETLTDGVNLVNIHALREDGIDLTVEEAVLLGGLDIPDETDTIVLPDGTGLELNPPALALLEFIGGWYVAPEWLRNQFEPNDTELAKRAFTKFYPDVLKRFPELLDSVPIFKRT